MGEVKTSIIVDLAGNIQQRGQQFISTLNNVGSQGVRSLSRLSQIAEMSGRGLDKLGNRYTALLTGASGIGAARMVMDHQRRLTRLGIVANRSEEDIQSLNEEIYRTAQAPDIRLDPSEITSAIEEIMEKTGDLRFAEQNIRNIALAIQATGGAGKDIGGVMSEFQKMGITDFKSVLESIDILNVQGKEGAFTLQNLAALGPRVITAYTSMGRGGIQSIRELGAAMQVIRQGTGGPEQAATAFEALMRTLSDGKKIKMLQKGGIKVFDPEALKHGKEVLRPINELMVEIVKRTGGRKTLLSKVFDAEAMRSFNSLIDEYKRTGDITSLDKFMRMQADGSTTIHDSARAAKDATAAVDLLFTSFKKFADGNLTKPIQSLADTMNSIDPEKFQTGMKVAGYAALGLGGLVVGRKVYQGAKGLAGMFRGGAGKAGALGGLAGGGGPIPVYVVNKHLSMLPGTDGFGANPSSPSSYGKGVLQKTAGSAAFLGFSPLIAPAISALAAETSMAIGKAISEKQAATSSPSTLRTLMGRHMVMGGGADSYQVKTIGSALNKGFSGEPLQSDVNLNIKIDDERVSVKRMSSNSRKVTPNVDAGLTMRSH